MASKKSHYARKLWILLVVIATYLILRELLVTIVQNPKSSENLASRRSLRMGLNEGLPQGLETYDFFSAKWIVLNAMTSKCSDVTSFTREKDWSVVVVTDKPRDITGCQPPECVQLSWSSYKQHMTHLSTTLMMTGSSAMFGYLYVISRGAKIILDGSCDTPISGLDQIFGLNQRHQSGLWYNGTLWFNPYQHINSQTRSVDDRKQAHRTQSENSEIYFVKDFGKVSLRQGIIATSTCGNNQNNIVHKPGQTPVVVGPETAAPLKSGATIFHSDAIWWMFSPPSMSPFVRNLFRTLWIHGIKRNFLVNLGFYYHTERIQSTVKEDCDMFEESVDIANLTSLITCTHVTSCPLELSPLACGVRLAQEVLDCMTLKRYISAPTARLTVSLLLAWMDDLLLMGVKEPKHLPLSFKNRNVFKIKYGYNKQSWQTMSLSQITTLQKNVFDFMAMACPKDTQQTIKSLEDWKSPVFDDVLLIVVLNYESLFSTLPYLEFIHRQSFRYILYCGPAVDNFIRYANETGVFYVTYIEGLSDGWHFMYECVTHAMKLHLPVKGYLQIGDDVLLNTWNLVDLPRDQIWMPKGFSKRDLYKTKYVKNWVHWNTTMGQNATIKVFSELQRATSSISFSSSHSPKEREFHEFARRFLANYRANIGMNYIIHRATDIFYIPEVLRNDYITASELFRDHHSLIEMAVPVIHLGLARKDKIIYMKGASLWGEERVNPWTFFATEKNYFIHPFKSLSHLKTEGGKNFFCKTFLPEYDGQLKNLKQKRF